MDIRCKHCGEPMDMDEFHDARQGTWSEWVASFREFGCSAVDAMFDGDRPEYVTKPCSSKPCVGEEDLEAIELLTDLLGDDVDGLSTTLQDYLD